MVNRIGVEQVANIGDLLVCALLAGGRDGTDLLRLAVALIKRVAFSQRPARVGQGTVDQIVDLPDSILVVKNQIKVLCFLYGRYVGALYRVRLHPACIGCLGRLDNKPVRLVANLQPYQAIVFDISPTEVGRRQFKRQLFPAAKLLRLYDVLCLPSRFHA